MAELKNVRVTGLNRRQEREFTNFLREALKSKVHWQHHQEKVNGRTEDIYIITFHTGDEAKRGYQKLREAACIGNARGEELYKNLNFALCPKARKGQFQLAPAGAVALPRPINNDGEERRNVETILCNLVARDAVCEILDQLQDNKLKNGLLICDTGTGKTRGLTLEAVIRNKKVVLVLPKAVQVTFQVEAMKAIFSSRKIGFAANSERQYQEGDCDLIVVTYGHFMSKLVDLVDPHQSPRDRQMRLERRLFPNYLIIFDEAHDSESEIIALLSISNIIPNQKIITSATLNLKSFQDFVDLSNYHIVRKSGSSAYPVAVNYLDIPKSTKKFNDNYKDQKFLDLLKCILQQKGKILIFVASVSEADKLALLIVSNFNLPEHTVPTIYGDMWQDEIIAEVTGQDVKVIVATNVLESSITIANLRIVIDFCDKIEKEGDYLVRCRISKAEAVQRAGRVGRVDAGTVYRVISKEEYDRLDEYPKCPLQVGTPIELVLKMSKAFHIRKIQEMLNLTPQQVHLCTIRLQTIGAMRGEDLTAFGRKLSEIPLSINFACPVCRAILDVACPNDVRALILLIAVAFSNTPSHFFRLQRNIRREKQEMQVDFVKNNVDVFRGESSMHTIINIFCELISIRNIFQGLSIDKWGIRDWCQHYYVNSKYVVKVLNMLSHNCRHLIRSNGHFTDLNSFPPMREVVNKIRRSRQGIREMHEIHEYISTALEYFTPFFSDRFVALNNSEVVQVQGWTRMALHMIEHDENGLPESKTVRANMIEPVSRNSCPLCFGALYKIGLMNAIEHEWNLEKMKESMEIWVSGIFEIQADELLVTCNKWTDGYVAEATLLLARSQLGRDPIFCQKIVTTALRLVEDPLKMDDVGDSFVPRVQEKALKILVISSKHIVGISSQLNASTCTTVLRLMRRTLCPNQRTLGLTILRSMLFQCDSICSQINGKEVALRTLSEIADGPAWLRTALIDETVCRILVQLIAKVNNGNVVLQILNGICSEQCEDFELRRKCLVEWGVRRALRQCLDTNISDCPQLLEALDMLKKDPYETDEELYDTPKSASAALPRRLGDRGDGGDCTGRNEVRPGAEWFRDIDNHGGFGDRTKNVNMVSDLHGIGGFAYGRRYDYETRMIARNNSADRARFIPHGCDDVVNNFVPHCLDATRTNCSKSSEKWGTHRDEGGRLDDLLDPTVTFVGRYKKLEISKSMGDFGCGSDSVEVRGRFGSRGPGSLAGSLRPQFASGTNRGKDSQLAEWLNGCPESCESFESVESFEGFEGSEEYASGSDSEGTLGASTKYENKVSSLGFEALLSRIWDLDGLIAQRPEFLI